MTVHVRAPAITVTYGPDSGSQTTITRVLKAHTTLGLDIAVAEATFSVPEAADLAGASYWDIVTIALTAGTATQDWVGYIVGFDFSLYPREIGVVCKGFLCRAELMMNTATASAGIGGTDMTNAGAGAADNDIATAILTACGIVNGPVIGLVHNPPILTIGGSTRLLGTLAGPSYYFAEGESGLSYLQRLDEACVDIGDGTLGGYRTYDEAAGNVRRQLITSIPTGSPAHTFTEGTDIFSGTSTQSIYTAKNRVIVTGFDDGLGGGPVTHTIQAANSYIPTPPQYITQQLSSPLIEFDTDAHLPTGVGMSCESVGAALLGQLNRTQVKVTFTTPLDTLILLATSIQVQGAGAVADRLGVATLFWVQRVERDIDGSTGEFSQVLTCIAGAGA